MSYLKTWIINKAGDPIFKINPVRHFSLAEARIEAARLAIQEQLDFAIWESILILGPKNPIVEIVEKPFGIVPTLKR